MRKSSCYRSLANLISSTSEVRSGAGQKLGDRESNQPGEKLIVRLRVKDPDVLYLIEAGPPTFTPCDIIGSGVWKKESGRGWLFSLLVTILGRTGNSSDKAQKIQNFFSTFIFCSL